MGNVLKKIAAGVGFTCLLFAATCIFHYRVYQRRGDSAAGQLLPI